MRGQCWANQLDFWIAFLKRKHELFDFSRQKRSGIAINQPELTVFMTHLNRNNQLKMSFHLESYQHVSMHDLGGKLTRKWVSGLIHVRFVVNLETSTCQVTSMALSQCSIIQVAQSGRNLEYYDRYLLSFLIDWLINRKTGNFKLESSAVHGLSLIDELHTVFQGFSANAI